MRFRGESSSEAKKRSSEYLLWMKRVSAAACVCPCLKGMSAWFQRPETRQIQRVFKSGSEMDFSFRMYTLGIGSSDVK